MRTKEDSGDVDKDDDVDEEEGGRVPPDDEEPSANPGSQMAVKKRMWLPVGTGARTGRGGPGRSQDARPASRKKVSQQRGTGPGDIRKWLSAIPKARVPAEDPKDGGGGDGQGGQGS